MPRRASSDAPGALCHVICRGIERRKIFANDADRDGVVRRLAAVLQDPLIFCCAWALMPDRFQLLPRPGAAPIPAVMQWVLSGGARRRYRSTVMRVKML
jgi:REP element-mobilizing transposase RayT